MTIPGKCESLPLVNRSKFTKWEGFRMDDRQSLSHSVWDCEYHVVWIPKCRRKTLYGQLLKHLGQVFRELARRKESRLEEGHLMVDHVHMLISIPPKYGVAQVVGFIKGKSTIHIARSFLGRKKNFTGQTSGPEATSYPRWAGMRQPSVNTIKKQEAEDWRIDQLTMFE